MGSCSRLVGSGVHRHRGSLCWISVRMGERLHVLEGWAGEQGSTMNQLAVGDEGSGSAQLSGWGVCKQAL